MNTRILTVLLSCLSFSSLNAAELALQDLGDLELTFQQATSVEHYPGKYLPAQVTAKQGQEFTLVAPMNIQQIDYLADSGQKLQVGAPFAKLRGSEVHHYVTEYEINQRMFALIGKSYQSNKVLFNKKAINESRWLEISKEYFDAKLENEHMRHFFDLVLEINLEDESLTLGAPSSGRIKLSEQTQVKMGDTIAIFVPQSAIKLKIAVPATQLSELEFVQTDSCKINIESVEDIASGSFVYAWSEALPESCNLQIGRKIRVTPYFQSQGFRVSKKAVFEWQGEKNIWVKQGQKITSVSVQLIAAKGDDYIFNTSTDLNAAQVLTSSVSAIQGILLGLGGD